MRYDVPNQLMIPEGKGGAGIFDHHLPLDFSQLSNTTHWKHIDYSQDQTIDRLQQIDRLDPLIREKLPDGNSRPGSELLDAIRDGTIVTREEVSPIHQDFLTITCTFFPW